MLAHVCFYAQSVIMFFDVNTYMRQSASTESTHVSSQVILESIRLFFITLMW